MKVLLLNYEFPPAGGGAGFATYNIGRELIKLGVEVDVLTSYIDGENDGDVLDGMTVHRVPSWRKGIHDCGMLGAYSYVAFAAFKRWQLHRAKTYDLEHFFFSMPTGALTLLPPQYRKKPYIVSLRGSDVPGYDLFNERLEKIHGYLKPITRKIWRNAKAVIALSNGLKDIAVKTDSVTPIGVIPNGIEENLFCPPSETKDATDPNRPIKLITVSRLLERKGIHLLLDAIATPPGLPVELEIIGTGSYEQALKKQVRDLKLEDKVSFKGFVNRNTLPNFYQKADIFVLPSMTESFGLVFAEAMSCELPVIGGRVGGVPELVRHETDGLLVDGGSTSSLRAALEQLLNDREKIAEMGRSARQRVLDGFTWSAVAKRYLETYQNAIKQ